MFASKTKLGESAIFDTAKRHDKELVMSIPPVPLCGDVCVEFFHKPFKLKKKVCSCFTIKKPFLLIRGLSKYFFHRLNKKVSR